MQSGEADPPTSPLPETPPERSKLRQRLHSLRAPFRAGSPFHIGSMKRARSTKSVNVDTVNKSPVEATKTRKNVKKTKSEKLAGDKGTATAKQVDAAKPSSSKNETGSLAPDIASSRKPMQQAGNCSSSGDESQVPCLDTAFSAVRAHAEHQSTKTPLPLSRRPRTASPLVESENTIGVEPHSSSTRGMESPLPPLPPLPPAERASPPAPQPPTDDAAVAVPSVAVTHPISTLPFTKSAWKPRAAPELPRPVEEPSPDSALRRRVAFIAQASTYLSEEREGEEEDEDEGEGEEVGSLKRVVELARERLAQGGSRTPTDCSDREEDMPAYGDLIAQDKNPQDAMGHASSHASASGAERREHLYKILVIGELGTGKTSIIKRYVHQFFSQHYRATIGVDFALKVLNWDANTVIRLQLWDIAGQERFGNMTRVYYKEAVGAFIVFDVTRVSTFDAVLKWKNDLDSKVQLPDGSPIPCILLANKCDQQKEGLVNNPAKMEEYCREKGFAGWFETSAKENVNIEEAARSLVNKILLNDKLLQSSDSKDSDRIAIDHKIANGDSQSGSSRSCAC